MSNIQKAVNGGKWITISTVVSTLFQFLQIAVLARLLAPADFGIVSVSNLIIGFFQVFANLGFSNSIIYKQESDRTVLSTLYFLNLLVGVFIFVVIHAVAPYIISFYHEPRLDHVLNLASYYFVIAYFGQMYMFLLEKELRFKSVAIIDITGIVAGTITTVVLANNGYHESSLVIGWLVIQTVKSILQIALGYRYFVPKLAFNLRGISEHLRFGIYNMGEGFLGFVQSNSDNLFLGALLGVKMLGYYTIAYQLAIFPIVKLNPIILQVAYPILAKMKDSAVALKNAYLKILDVITYCNLPLLAGLFITADGVVPLIYGPGWEPTIGLIRLFVFIGVSACLSHPLYIIAFTKGKPNLLFYLNLGTLLLKIPLVYILGTHWGLTGIAVAFLSASILSTLANLVIVQHLIGDFLSDFLRNFVKPILFCLIMISAVSLYKTLVGNEGLVNIILEISLGGLTYVILTFAYKLSFAQLKAYQQGTL